MTSPLDPQHAMDENPDDLTQLSQTDDQLDATSTDGSGEESQGFSDGDEGSQLPTGRPPGGQRQQ